MLLMVVGNVGDMLKKSQLTTTALIHDIRRGFNALATMQEVHLTM
jgi:hypothetical protein